ncbi:DNA ligase [Neisseria lisongii]
MRTLIPILAIALAASPATAVDFLLAKQYTTQDVTHWAMSEKLDGVRAYWDGNKLISRQGYAFTPPQGYTADFPPYPMDGELYSGRQQFEHISATVRRHNSSWHDIKLHVFDVPAAQGNLYQRLAVLQKWLHAHPKAPIVIIKQIPVKNREHVFQYLKQIEALGGEGVMLRNPNLAYAGGRSDQLLKLKSIQDAECTVTRHYEGKGKNSGKLGAIGCKNQLGEFKIGSGFKDADRLNPPPVGSVITYRYRGFTKKGTPRFATYFRKRSDR